MSERHPAVVDVAEFDITDPLPTGTTLLEASAGTGKTWAIAALVTRLVAEGHAELDDLLVVTFGRAASAELKDRVRERLVEADTTLTTGSAPESDALLTLLLDAPEAERAQRRRRLRRAVARFDEATITTTHGFCHAVLRSLGTTGDVEPGSALIEDDTEIVDQVVADLYLRAVGMGATPPFDHAEAGQLGRRAVEDPSAHLLPTDAPQGSPPDLRRRFAGAVRDESARRRLAARTLSYDDLLQRLAEALEPEASPARTVMRDRWRFVLVDEFQDTDPVQWQILERAFLGHATMVLVGDPKQAIYGFRGGDVDTYLRAAAQADTRRTLVENHRSDAPLVAAVDTVLRGAALGDPEILVRPARAALTGSRLHDPEHEAPFRLRALLRSDAQHESDAPLKIGDVRPRVAADVAGDIAALLRSGATYDHGAGPVPLTAGDVAILVERHLEADLLHEALARLGVPAVRSGGPDVLQSDAGLQWVTLLTALESPHRSGYVRAAALGPFLGLTAADLATGGTDPDGDGLTDRVSAQLRDLADLQRERGTAGMVEALTGDPAVVERLLRHEGGRRQLTDLEHVGHVLAGASREHGLGLSGLLRWLLDRRSESAPSADRTRRLDTDADAVQIVTTFVSKGLQYPVVYVPFLFDRYVPTPTMVRLHDADGRRCLDVGGDGPSWRTHAARSDAERAGEALRLLYVAMTRAQSRLVMHWAPTFNGKHAALHRALFRPDPDDPVVPDTQPVPSDHDAVARLRAWQDRGGPVVEQMVTQTLPLDPAPADGTELVLRRLGREVDTTWTRTSYTSLVRRDDGRSVASEPETVGPDDEVDVVADVDFAPTLGPSPWADLVGGAALGTLVHGVLEDVDADVMAISTDAMEREVRLRVEEQLARRPIAVDVEALVPALVGALRTPLGALADDLTLAEALARRPFREMDFELPLAGGDRRGRVDRPGTLADVADLMEQHLAAADPLRPFAAELRDASLRGRTLRGYLTGSIDLLLRLDGDRSLVVDHKTNRLESPDLTDAGGGLEAYAPDRLAGAMLHTTYPLQALLYAVAQHRFLRWRLRGYDPDEHLAGVLYLFVRGMTGPDVPRGADGAPYGVFAWRPPTSLVLGLSDLLDGRFAR
ncbi:UvrD-helicase domain-containing protein [Aeromicrobium sp.]|uniref:UvrD-helicase domain-containing protein n=1 Tax=Aeromicrobium sp. TaxID=1871063 RepID=UPI0040337114